MSGVRFIVDVGGELLFFFTCSTVLCHGYYAATFALRERSGGTVQRFGSALLNIAMATLFIAQLLLFGASGLEDVDEPFFDDRNRFLYFWVAGIAFGFACSYPFYRRRLVRIGRGFLGRP